MLTLLIPLIGYNIYAEVKLRQIKQRIIELDKKLNTHL